MMRYEARAKRPREQSPSDKLRADDVVGKVYQAVTPEQRLAVTQTLLTQLQAGSNKSPSPTFCNSLLKAGVSNALCLHLGFVFNRSDASGASTKEEVDNICWVLNLIYRSCTEDAREESISDIGYSLFHILIRGMSWGVLLPVLSTLHVCSGGMRGTTLLFQCGIIAAIATLLQSKKIENESTLLEALGILKNLSYYGEEYRLEMAEHNTLLSHLAKIPFLHRGTPTSPPSKTTNNDKVLERLSAIFRNLAVSPSPRPLLAQKSYILSAVARMGSHSSRQIHRNILNFLLSIGQEMDSCVILCLHGDGILVNLLKRLMRNEADAAIRKRAVRITRMLACEGSASLLVHDSTLISALSQRALHDISNEVRTEATNAIVQLAAFIKAPMAQHQEVLDALTHLASSPTTQPEVLALALMKQAAQPTNRLPMAERRMLLESLAQIALSTETTNLSKEHACCAMLDLTRKESNRSRIATCSILEALTQNSMAGDRDDHGHGDQRQVFGIKALVNLATVPTNRKAMANHNLLLQTLVLYAASSQVNEVKKNVKKAILMLVSEL